MSERVVVAATLTHHTAQAGGELANNWLLGLPEDTNVSYFAALELDGRGIGPFHHWLAAAGAWFAEGLPHWTYSLDDGRNEITTLNRLRHIVVGQNLAAEYALEQGAHLFMVGTGVRLPPNCIERLLPKFPEFGIVGPYVPSYNLRDDTKRYSTLPGWQQIMPAGAMLISHTMLERGLRWRSHAHSGLSDDWGLVRDAHRIFGKYTATDITLVARKYPEACIPVEQRSVARDIARG